MNRPRLGLICALGVGIALSPSRPACAQSTAPDRCLEDLTDAELEARIASVERAFRLARPRARRWFWSWVAINGAVMVGTAAAAAAFRHTPVQRDSDLIGAAGSAATLLLMFAPPLPAVFALERLEAMPMDSRAARIARLREGLRQLEATARRERVGTGPLNYVLAYGYTAFTGLYLGLRYHGTDDAALITALSVVGTAAIPTSQILSAPTQAITDWDRLRTGALPCMASSLRPPAPRPVVRLAPAPAGLGLAVRF